MFHDTLHYTRAKSLYGNYITTNRVLKLIDEATKTTISTASIFSYVILCLSQPRNVDWVRSIQANRLIANNTEQKISPFSSAETVTCDMSIASREKVTTRNNL